MGKVKRIVLVVTAVLIALIGAYFVARIAASLMQGYSWQEMDWRQRGSTSIEDFFAASEIGKREIHQEGKRCVEYFSYKDGLPVKVVCSK
jgi:hypothetical protein